MFKYVILLSFLFQITSALAQPSSVCPYATTTILGCVKLGAAGGAAAYNDPRFSGSGSGGASLSGATFTGPVSIPTLTITGSVPASTVMVGPAGTAGIPTQRNLSNTDISGLGPLALVGYPSTGICYSSGSSLLSETISTGLTESGGTLSCKTATTSQVGCVKPDGTTITASGGTIGIGSVPVAAVTGALSTTTAATTYLPISNPTATGTLTASALNLTGSVAPSTVMVGPAGSAGVPTQRVLDVVEITNAASAAYVGAAVTGLTGSNFQVFSVSGTWTKPAKVTTCTAFLVAGGASGGGGGTIASGQSGSGGGGGGSGNIRRIGPISAAGLPTSAAVTVGAGGAAAAAGTNGYQGGSSSIAWGQSPSWLNVASGPGGGGFGSQGAAASGGSVGGTTSSAINSNGPTPGTTGSFGTIGTTAAGVPAPTGYWGLSFMLGQTGSGCSAIGVCPNGSSVLSGTVSGGSGGGMNAGTPSAGGNSGANGFGVGSNGGVATGAAGATGESNTQWPADMSGGRGGGGGGGNAAGVGGPGGAGGFPGGGGGGGGSGRDGGGISGVGGNGVVVVKCE